MSLSAQCPGATLIETATEGPASLCGPLRLRREEQAVSLQPSGRWALFTERHDPVTLREFCCGDYTRCTIWRDERDRERAARLPQYDAGHWNLLDQLVT